VATITRHGFAGKVAGELCYKQRCCCFLFATWTGKTGKAVKLKLWRYGYSLLCSHFLVRRVNLRDRRPDVDAFWPDFAAFVSKYKACKAIAEPT
jgi:hypothetical protein